MDLLPSIQKKNNGKGRQRVLMTRMYVLHYHLICLPFVLRIHSKVYILPTLNANTVDFEPKKIHCATVNLGMK